MILICFGIPKSGSTALFNICWHAAHSGIRQSQNYRDVIRLSDVDPAFARYAHGFVSNKDDLGEIIDAVLTTHDSQERLIFIKTHNSCQKTVRNFLQQEKVTGIGSFRHPADVALSLIDASFRDRAKGIERFSYFDLDSAAHVLPWFNKIYRSLFDDTNCIPVYYDWIAQAPEAVLGLITKRLNLVPDTADVLGYFNSDKQRYGEFNKGVTRRRLSELSPQQVLDLAFQAPHLAGASLLYENKFDCSDLALPESVIDLAQLDSTDRARKKFAVKPS